MKYIIKGGRVINPARKFDAVADVLVEDGKIKAVGENLAADGAEDLADAEEVGQTLPAKTFHSGNRQVADFSVGRVAADEQQVLPCVKAAQSEEQK